MYRQILIVAALVLLSSSVFGRAIENWSYERLFKEAELVVIATAESTTDTKERAKLGWEADFIGQDTSFSVHTALKGDLKKETKITVFHYRAPEKALFANGPLLATFHDKPIAFKGTIGDTQFERAAGKPDYLLFLRKRADGRYEPVSGHVDPVLSVRELTAPMNSLYDLSRKSK
jgi:hypothetical protein